MKRDAPHRAAFSGALIALAMLGPARARAVAPTPAPPELITGSESVATTDGAAAAFFNPAGLGVRYPGEAFFSWTRFEGHAEINHGVLAGGGLGVLFTRIKDRSQFFGGALAVGSPRLRLGLVQGVLKTDRSSVGDERLGLLFRPGPALSLGAAVAHLTQPKLDGVIQSRHYDAGIGLRPAARLLPGRPDLADRVTLSADLVIPDDGEWSQSRARFGAELEPVRGFVLRGAVEDHGGWHLGLTLRAPNLAISAHSARDGAGFQDYRTGSVSLHGGEDLSVFAPRTARRIAEIRVAGNLADENIAGFSLLGGGGSSTRAVAPLEAELDRAREDPLTRGVLLRIDGVSGMANLEELRPRLAAIRAAGKPIVAFLPYGAGRGDLYLASACDRIVSTPEADFQQLGLRSERRYYRRLLESLGVRLDRVSIGQYKSAYRNLSVDSTTVADREV
ncbi:MAG TPA: S49 family peptidase, partial [Candidatus Udaeobacter sp.]|nr:S49 family peptidase [Candidatus Udaeobacter sp.]